jgi:multiple sugar transport system substrate-binding protein
MADIRFLGCDQDAFCASVARHVSEFEEASGHRVDVQLIDNDEYFTNKLAPYLDGEEPADVYMSGPVLMWEQLGAGHVEPLDPFLERAGSDYDPDDFLATLIRCNRWSGRFGEPLGEGPLLELPVNCESYNLAYVPGVLERAGAEVPRTWEDYFAVARRIAERAAPCRGFGQRGANVWHTIYTGFASQLWSYGGRDFDEAGACVIASPAALRATGDILAALRDAGPTDWPNQRWYELAIDFANGKYGLIVDSDHYVAYFEDPKTSSVSGKVGYALPPLGPSGERSSNLWTWSMVMNANSPDKNTTWEFMEWKVASAPIRIRGQHESHACERLGGLELPGTGSGLGRLCRCRKAARRKRQRCPRNAGCELHRRRATLDWSTAGCLRRCGFARGLSDQGGFGDRGAGR